MNKKKLEYYKNLNECNFLTIFITNNCDVTTTNLFLFFLCLEINQLL